MIDVRSRSLAAVAVGVLLLAPLAGCGGDKKDAKPSSSSTTTPSADATGQKVDKAAFLNQVTAAMGAEETVHMKIDGGTLITADADVQYADDGARIKMTAKLMGADQQMVLAGKDLYIQQGAGGKYLKFGTDDPTFGKALASFAGIGPRDAVSGMKPGITKVVQLGEKKIDGEQTTAYRLTVDTKKASGVFKTLAGNGIEEQRLTLDFYVGDDKLPRRIATDVSGQKVVLTFTKWGQDVDIAVPSGSELMNSAG